MPGQAPHRLLFAEEPHPVGLIATGPQHLDRHFPVERRLVALVDDAEAAASRDPGVGETGCAQIVRDLPRRGIGGLRDCTTGHRAS